MRLHSNMQTYTCALLQTALCLLICVFNQMIFLTSNKAAFILFGWASIPHLPLTPIPPTAPQPDQFSPQNPTEVLPCRLETIS